MAKPNYRIVRCTHATKETSYRIDKFTSNFIRNEECGDWKAVHTFATLKEAEAHIEDLKEPKETVIKTYTI